MRNKVYFSVKSGLKDIIGRDLILDDNIAIFELVKNSYDAHAKNVFITFERDKIIIADDGKGMSLKDLTEKWLSVAWSAKSDGTEDEDVENDFEKKESYRDKIQTKRHYAGAKGIGRFSADRLGQKLVLTTSKNGQQHIEQLHITWEEFNKRDKSDKILKQDFEKIPVEHETLNSYHIPFPNNSLHGTILEITGTEKWNRERIKMLKHSLEKLINPFSETDEFRINIFCDREFLEDNIFLNGKPKYTERDKINGEIKNSILEVIKLKTTHLEVIVSENRIQSKLFDRGSLIYHIEEPNIFNPFIESLKLDLYYLNRSAKYNFSKIMGVQPVQYGSVFLFKNGFRVQPYGEFEDDSWNLNSRAQQGYNRFLSTRELFGRVDIITEDTEQFKEVSSRDGGLKKTVGYNQLFNIFWDYGLKRLERYVVGVLWGEAFLKNNYFKSKDEGLRLRELLLEKDKDSDDISIAKSNLGSKLDFARLIKSLADNKDITIKNFNKELLDFVNESLDVVEEKFISDLKKIAEVTNDKDIWDKTKEAENAFQKIKQEKEEAELRAQEEEKKRIKAEKKAQEEEIKRIEAERKAQEEEERRKNAELETAKKEKERLEAENNRLKAELKATEEEKKRRSEEDKRKEVEQERDVEKNKNKYLSATRNLTPEVEDIIHTIKISSNELESSSKSIMNLAKDIPAGNKILHELGYIQFHIERINKLSSLLTKADINALKEHTKVDIPTYIKEYLPNYVVSIKDIQFNNSFADQFIRKISLLDLSVILDNLVSNSKKAGAERIYVDFKKENGKLFVDFSDDGSGVDDLIVKNNSLFEVGITNRRGGSGIGLNTIKETLRKELHGDIEFIGNNKHFKKGATFRLIF